MEVSARTLTKLGPIIADMVRENSKDIRNHAKLATLEEQEHLFFIADTMDSSLESANKALETHALISGIVSRYEKTMDPSILKQLQTVQSNQQAIVKCNAKSLFETSRHYQQQFMPGSDQGAFPTSFSDTPDEIQKALPFVEASKSNEVVKDEKQVRKQNQCKTKEKNETKKSKRKMAMEMLVTNSTYQCGFIQQLGKFRPTENGDSNEKSKTINPFLNKNFQWPYPETQKCSFKNENGKKKESLNSQRVNWIKTAVCLTNFLLAVSIVLKNDSFTNTVESNTSPDIPDIAHNQD